MFISIEQLPPRIVHRDGIPIDLYTYQLIEFEEPVIWIRVFILFFGYLSLQLYGTE